MNDDRPLIVDLLIGAAAGAAATWVMDRVTTALYERQSEKVTQKEEDARGGETAYVAAAGKAASLIGRELSDQEKQKAGEMIHWALGIGAGATYGGLRNVMPALGPGSGVAFATLWWAALDEGANPILGLTPPPQEFPWQTHARGLAGHLVLGAVLDTFFAAVDLTLED
jgi:hypothetical protein